MVVRTEERNFDTSRTGMARIFECTDTIDRKEGKGVVLLINVVEKHENGRGVI